MHGSARDMAGVFVASLAPTVVLGPLAGMFADRWDPRRTMIASDVARGTLVLLLAVADTLPQIWAISFAVSCLFELSSRRRRAITLPLAGSAAISYWRRMRACSRACRWCGLRVRRRRARWWRHSASAFATRPIARASSARRSCSQLCAIGGRRTATSPRAALEELSAGFAFLFTNPAFSFVVFSMTAGTFAAGCFGALASVYVRDVLHCGPSMLGMIGMLIGAGTVAGSIALSLAPFRSGARRRDPRR